MKRSLSYMISMSLFVLYLFVFCNAEKMNVSKEYQMFYIDHELKYYLPDNELCKYVIDQEWEYNQDAQSKNIDRGWGTFENSATWMGGGIFILCLA